MLKKTLTAAAIAGAIILGSASPALAGVYPPDVDIEASAVVATPGSAIIISVSGLEGLDQVTFTHDAPTGTLSSIVAASAAGRSVVKPVANGSASATFTSTATGDFTISVFDGSTLLQSIAVSVAPAGSGSDDASGALPPTGSDVPAAAIWLGVGAIGLGGIAVAAVAARRRTQKTN